MQARQGDLWFRPKAPPTNRKPNPMKSLVLAHGEVTGHAHQITSPSISEMDSYVDESGDIFIKSDQPIVVDHDEHGTVTLDPGEWYCMSRQREYDPLAAERERQVAD